MKYLFLVLLVSCERRPEVKKERVFTSLQSEYLASLPLDKKIYMEGCLAKNPEIYDFNYCMDKLNNSFGLTKPTQIQTSGENSVLGTAAGTAVGIGAAKLLFGR